MGDLERTLSIKSHRSIQKQISFRDLNQKTGHNSQNLKLLSHNTIGVNPDFKSAVFGGEDLDNPEGIQWKIFLKI